MSKEIIEKLDAIEAANTAKIEEVITAAAEKVEAVKAEVSEQIAALEAKISQIPAPSIIRAPAKTIRQDVNRSVREQLTSFYKSNNRVEKELQIFADESQYSAYLAEASALTAGGNNQGGRTGYDLSLIHI